MHNMHTERNDLLEQAGLLWSWWQGDLLPELPELPTLAIDISANIKAVAALTNLTEEQVSTKLQSGHHPYTAVLDGVHVACGWSAMNAASFGSQPVRFWVPQNERYLYGFVTLPEW